jgi:hypothetical protein
MRSDIKNVLALNKIAILIISGDATYVPDDCTGMKAYFFVTHLRPESNCNQTQIPYYRNLKSSVVPNNTIQIMHDMVTGNGPTRELFLSFRGSIGLINLAHILNV